MIMFWWYSVTCCISSLTTTGSQIRSVDAYVILTEYWSFKQMFPELTSQDTFVYQYWIDSYSVRKNVRISSFSNLSEIDFFLWKSASALISNIIYSFEWNIQSFCILTQKCRSLFLAEIFFAKLWSKIGQFHPIINFYN